MFYFRDELLNVVSVLQTDEKEKFAGRCVVGVFVLFLHLD